MILLLDTSTNVCKLTLIDGEQQVHDEWQADRTLARGLLAYLQTHLSSQGKAFSDLSGIGVFEGPGSFTGLRIGITVLNTLAEVEHIAIVGVRGDDWQKRALERLLVGEDDKIVLPFYGSEAHITTPRK